MNIFMILTGDAPSVFKTAISACLSTTTITRVEIILKAATAIIRVRITNMTSFCVFRAWKKFLFLCVQSIMPN